jgi:hypothetical protein
MIAPAYLPTWLSPLGSGRWRTHADTSPSVSLQHAAIPDPPACLPLDTCPGADVFAAGPTWSIFATLRWAETCFTSAFFVFAALLPRQPSTYPLNQASGPGHGSLCDTRCTAAFATGFVCLILSRGFAGQARPTGVNRQNGGLLVQRLG